MIFDMQDTLMTEGILIFPSFVYSAEPEPPQNIKETVVITGSSTSSQSITGTADQKE